MRFLPIWLLTVALTTAADPSIPDLVAPIEALPSFTAEDLAKRMGKLTGRPPIEADEPAVGALLTTVARGGANEAAGLARGDVIVAVDGVPISELSDETRRKPAELTVWTKGTTPLASIAPLAVFAASRQAALTRDGFRCTLTALPSGKLGAVVLDRAVRDLEALRGLPLESLDAERCDKPRR